MTKTTTTRKTTIRKGKVRVYPGQLRSFKRVAPRMISRLPTVTETFVRPSTITSNLGGVFKVAIDEIPQIAQYSNLYRQYRINWVKFTIVPNYNSFDGTGAAAGVVAMPRIAWAINDTPKVAPPISEADVLEDNGAKVRQLATTWSASCRPVANVALTSTDAGTPLVPVRAKRRFYNFLAEGQNPLHEGISYWITAAAAAGSYSQFNVYVKVNFTLRDPQ